MLFVRPKDREREIWDGYRAGAEGAVEQYGADAAYPVSELSTKLREYAIGRSTVFYKLGSRRYDDTIVSLLQTVGDERIRSGRPD